MSSISRPRYFFRLVFFLGIFVLTGLLFLSSFEVLQSDYNPVVDRICAIPELDPWDKSVLKYIETSSSKIECPKAYNILFVNDTGFLVYNKTALKFYSLSEQLLTCKYQIVKRTLGDKEVKFEPEVIFNPPVFINGTIFRVSCKNNKRLVYDFLHLNPYWVEDENREKEIGVEDDDHYSVLLIGIDSVSRSHALRNLQKSYKYLNETLGAYDFKGYMKVGSNSYPNLIPLLTGMRHGNFPLVNNRVSYCDSMPFLWNSKEMKHYATLYSEDRADISTFNLMKPGFYHSPTDFYYRPYNMAMDLFTPVLMTPVGTEGKMCPWACPCYANKDNFTTQVDHFKGFLNRFKNKLKFALFWANSAHESFGRLRKADDSILELLQWMHTNGHTHRSVVAVISDHGLRLGQFSESHIGRLEGHFPFLSLLVPDQLKHKYPWMKSNLVLNSNRMITNFDIHKTIADIASGNFDEFQPPVESSHVARNVFARIPKTRTCSDAGIAPNFCTCLSDNVIVPVNDTLARKLALHAVDNLNFLLCNQSHICRHLSLYSITEARVQYTCLNAAHSKRNTILEFLDPILTFDMGVDKGDECGRSGRYKLLFHVLPSKGLFEVMIEYNEQAVEVDQMTVIGDIARIDRYGEQSHCIKNNALLREYCYCKDLPTDMHVRQ